MVQTLPIMNFNLQELDQLTSKVQLAKMLGVSRQTLNVYHGLASLYIDGFYQNYPKVGERVYTRAGMSKYQAWVLGKLIYEGMRLTYKVLSAQLKDSEYAGLFDYSQYIKTTIGSRQS